ncbi:MAG: transcription termination/antitermination factor NusG [Clostridia bacterium]|nr:transcription termination/antitermination factor NusG [Clostridia bacterium]
MAITGENIPLWYVVHTYSGYENKVATNIEKTVENRNLGHLIFSVKIPTEKVLEVPEDDENDYDDNAPKKPPKEVERKLFPSYVMVKMIMNDESWHIVRNIIGVTGFVGPGSSPVALTDEEVEKFGVEIKVVEIKFKVGDSVKICDGPLTGFIGIVEEISDDKKKVKVTASLFGRETKVELNTNQVKALDNE